MQQVIVGIDPGFSGAIAMINYPSGKILLLEDMPVVRVGKRKELYLAELRGWLHVEVKIVHAFIEKAQPMPDQGIVSTGRYMKSFGELIGLCEGLWIPYTLVHPTSWKRAMLKDMEKGKEASIKRVQELYPDLKLSRKKDHGKADAILIARYGWQTILGGKV